MLTTSNNHRHDTTTTLAQLTPQTFSGYSPATCGELVQGLIGEEYCLINCPINTYSHVQVHYSDRSGIQILTDGQYSRLALVLERYLSHINNNDYGLAVTINTNIPRSKGMASSTSELTAALCAAAKALDRKITPEIISKLIIGIEPSDGIYYAGITRYSQLTGKVYEHFGNPPPMGCIVVDTGGTLDTQDYDRERALKICREFEPVTQQALSLVRKGFEHKSPTHIAEAATLSAECNQKILYKPIFETLLSETRAAGALGVNCAHTGTVCGVLFDPRQTDRELLFKRLESIVPYRNIIGCYRIIAGGV